jgi:hypothetical protein
MAPKTEREVPATIARSAPSARKVWLGALDGAIAQYGESERAYRTAYAALKHTHEKVGDRWVDKGRKGPSDAQAEKTGAAARRGGPTAGGVDANATKAHLLDVARRLDVRGRSRMTKAELVTAIQRANDRETARVRRREGGSG